MVLHVRVFSGNGGGPEKTILRSAQYAHAAGLRTAAAYLHPRGEVGMELIRSRASRQECPLVAIPESVTLRLYAPAVTNPVNVALPVPAVTFKFPPNANVFSKVMLPAAPAVVLSDELEAKVTGPAKVIFAVLVVILSPN